MTTMKDVAILAGVSPITVSRVINEPDTVKAATRLKVEKAMKALEEGDCNRLWVAVEEGSMVPGSLPEPETAGEFAFDRYRFTLYRLR